MNQDQPRRDQEQQQQMHDEGIKYGDVFPVSGNLAGQTVAPRDARMMQAAEDTVLGQTEKGGPAATMQSVTSQNERAGVVGHDQSTDVSRDKGVTITETFVPGGRIITEFVAGQVRHFGKYVHIWRLFNFSLILTEVFSYTGSKFHDLLFNFMLD